MDLTTANGQLQGLMQRLILAMLCLLVVVTFLGWDTAIAQPLNASLVRVKPDIPATITGNSSLPNSSTTQPLQQFVQQTQSAFDQSIRNTQAAIQDLPQQLEQLTSGASSQIQQELETRKDLLDDAADFIDSLGKKINKFGGALSQTSSKSVQKVFDDAADAIEVLTDDIEDAENGASAVLRAQIDQHIQSVNQALEQAKQSLQALSQKPA